jgi:hypothetical protein
MDQNVLAEYLTDEDPSPELQVDPEHIDDPIGPEDGDEPFEFDAPEPLEPAAARAAFDDYLRRLREDGKTELAARDFRPIMRPGMGRAWVQARLKEAVDRGELAHDPDARTYTFAGPVLAGR